MLEKHNKNMHYLNLINIKNNGGLVIPSADVVKILKKCEDYFNAYVTGSLMRRLCWLIIRLMMNILVAVGQYPVVCALCPGILYRQP